MTDPNPLDVERAPPSRENPPEGAKSVDLLDPNPLDVELAPPPKEDPPEGALSRDIR